MPVPVANTMSNEIISGLQTRFGSIDYSQFQSLRYQFYSYVTYPTAGATQLNFFGTTTGSPGVTLADTNMPRTGSFGQQHFFLKSIGTRIKLQKTNDLSAFDGTDASSISSDFLFGFLNNPLLIFLCNLFRFFTSFRWMITGIAGRTACFIFRIFVIVLFRFFLFFIGIIAFFIL